MILPLPPIHVHSSRFGKVDQVSGLFYVATSFVHFAFIPIEPLASYVVMEGTETGKDFRGVKIPLSYKSVILAWVRSLLGVSLSLAGLGTLIGAIVWCSESNDERGVEAGIFGLASLGCALAICGLLWLSLRLTRATPSRALELAAAAQITPDELADHLAR
jgi:hypothetical protein